MSRTNWLAPILTRALGLALALVLGLGAVACGEVRCARPVTPDREPAPPDANPQGPGGPQTPPTTPPAPE